MNEPIWKTAPAARGFTESHSDFGKPESMGDSTVVHFLYDDAALYIGGFCYEPSRDSVLAELVNRDDEGANDWLLVTLDTYNDKQNAFGFVVTPLGQQMDIKYSSQGEDMSWNAVWYSEAKIHADGWSFEMRIPWSALRFSKEKTVWGMNVQRNRKKAAKMYAWSPVDPKVNGLINQESELTGLENIKPPLRLSLSPYFSTYANHYPYSKEGLPAKNFTSSVNGGLDLKYGLSQNFTLDLTLIPDFGQVPSDGRVLNLTPYEVRYEEKRPFFTEGTDLFTKGSLFYSRRIGSTPIHKYDVEGQLISTEVLDNSPSESKLLNAFKFSGRTRKGLGIGLLNAIVKPMYATVLDTLTGRKRELQTSTLTNYSVAVLDQTLKNNSSLSLINTNVMRSGADYDANVTAGLFEFHNKANTLYVRGQVSLSHIFDKENTRGYSHNLSFGKDGGKLTFGYSQDLADSRFEINDLGILNANDYVNHNVFVNYKFLKTTGWYNRVYLRSGVEVDQSFTNARFRKAYFNIRPEIHLKNGAIAGGGIVQSTTGRNFDEPRIPGWWYNTPSAGNYEMWYMRNEAKKYFFDAALAYEPSNLHTEKGVIHSRMYYAGTGQRYRFNQKFSLKGNFTFMPVNDQVGFGAAEEINSIRTPLFVRRNRITSVNNFGGKYNFNKNMGITLGVRHYWSQVTEKEFYRLRSSGAFTKYEGQRNPGGYNINFFNVDMDCYWEFAPGSFLNIYWKNAVESSDPLLRRSYFANLHQTFLASQNNNLSLKVIYYLDALDARRWMHKKVQ